jgi:NADH dehydrogenase (ubiquinone) Fe-S protein 2
MQQFTLNFGPVHPAAHGVLRLILEMNHEYIVRADPHIGFLHRGTEKLMEMKPVIQVMPYMDRLDYMSAMANEHAFLMAVEKLCEIPVPLRGSYIRVIFLEITRLLNHLLAVACAAADVGALTPILWTFEEREKLMTFYEMVSGSRMHPNYFRPGGVSSDIPYGFLDQLYEFINQFAARIDEVEDLLTMNNIYRQRLKTGYMDLDRALSYGFSGPMLRGAGVAWDLRVTAPYEVYPYLDVEVPYGVNSDSYDRYLIRMQEMRNSIRIIHQCINDIVPGEHRLHDAKFANLPFKDCKDSMENLIAHFKYYSEGFRIPEGFVYSAVESPKGELGVYLQGNGDSLPYRVRIRAPGFYHLAALPYLVQDTMIPDLVTIMGTLDIVFGEVDR